MPRPRDEASVASAAALYASGASAPEAAAAAGVHERTVRRWPEVATRGPGPRGRTDVDTADIVRMRDAEGLSWRQVAAAAGMSVTGARKRYEAAKSEEQDMSDGSTGPALAPPGIRQAARITLDALRRNGLMTVIGDLLALRPGPGREDRLRAAADRMAERGEDPAGVAMLRAAIDGTLTQEAVRELRAGAGDDPEARR